MRREQLVLRVYVTSGQRARCCSSSAGPCVAPAAGSSASRPTVAGACACTAFLACAHTIHRTAARRLRTHASEAAQQPPQQPSLIGRPVHLVRGSLRLGPLADGRARGNRTPDRRVRAISRCFYSRFRGGADAQGGCASRELELATCRCLVPSAAPSRPATINVGPPEAVLGQPERAARARFASLAGQSPYLHSMNISRRAGLRRAPTNRWL